MNVMGGELNLMPVYFLDVPSLSSSYCTFQGKNADHGSQPGSTRQSQTLHHGGSKQSSIYLPRDW